MTHANGNWMNADQKAATEDSDFDNYQGLIPEERLRVLAKHYQQAEGDYRRFFEGRLIELTCDMDEHPEWFGDLGIPCVCQECCSNA